MAINVANFSYRQRLDGAVPSALVGVVELAINHQNVDTSFWSNVKNDGGDIRVCSDADGINQLPVEVNYIDVPTQKLLIFTRVTGYDLTSTSIYLFCGDPTATQPPVDQPFGTREVWQDYAFVSHDTLTEKAKGYISNTLGTTANLTAVEDVFGIPNNAGDSTGNCAREFPTTGTELSFDLNLQQYGLSARINHRTGANTRMMSFYQDNSMLQFIGLNSTSKGTTTHNGSPITRPLMQWTGLTLTSGVETDYTFNTDTTATDGFAFQEFGWADGVQSNGYTNQGSYSAGTQSFRGAFLFGRPGLTNSVSLNGTLQQVRLKNSPFSDAAIALHHSNNENTASFWTQNAPDSPGGSGSSVTSDVAFNGLQPTFNADIDVSAQLVNVIKVESFDVDVNAVSGFTHTLTKPIDTAHAFVRRTTSIDKQTGVIGTTSNINPNQATGAAWLSSSNTIEFAQPTVDSRKIIGEVWNYIGAPDGENAFVVRGQFAITLAASSTTASQAVSGIVNRDKCIPFITGSTSDATAVSQFHSATASVYIDSSDTIQCERGGSSGTLVVYVTVVEFTGSNWQVGHGRSANHDTTSEVITLNTASDGLSGSTFDVGDWTTATFIDASLEADTSETGLSDNLGVWTTNADTTKAEFVLHRDTSARNDGVSYCHVLKHADMKVTRQSDTNFPEGDSTYVNAPWPTGAATDGFIEHLSLEWFSDTTGTGTAHARGRLSARITDATGTIDVWVQRSGNEVRADWGVIELTNIQSEQQPPPATINSDVALTGLQPTFGTSVDVSVPPGVNIDVAISRLQPVFNASINLSPPGGVVTDVALTGLLPTFGVTATIALPRPSSLDVAFTGLQPTFATSVLVSTPGGVASDVALTGLQPTFGVTATIVEPASVNSDVVITGLQPTFNTSVNVATPGVFTSNVTLTGLQPTFDSSVDVTIPPGVNSDVTLTGLQPTFGASINVEVPGNSVSVTLTGLQPTFDSSVDVSVPVYNSTVALAGLTPTFNVLVTNGEVVTVVIDETNVSVGLQSRHINLSSESRTLTLQSESRNINL